MTHCTEAAKQACRDRCAELGEPPCWQVDQQPESEGDAMRGIICGECRREANYNEKGKGK